MIGGLFTIVVISCSDDIYNDTDFVAGETFTDENVRSVRPGFGLHPRNLVKIIGKTARRRFKKGERITQDLLNEQD